MPVFLLLNSFLSSAVSAISSVRGIGEALFVTNAFKMYIIAAFLAMGLRLSVLLVGVALQHAAALLAAERVLGRGGRVEASVLLNFCHLDMAINMKIRSVASVR
jgi:hypothetical protein